MNNISVGMTKDQVISKLGKPDSSGANESEETMIYELHDSDMNPRNYDVVIKDGKVIRYGPHIGAVHINLKN